jgi:hypothetical protein
MKDDQIEPLGRDTSADRLAGTPHGDLTADVAECTGNSPVIDTALNHEHDPRYRPLRNVALHRLATLT